MAKAKEDDGFDPQVAADANGVPFTGDDGKVYRPSYEKDLSNDMPDKYPGIGLDRGDIFLDEFGREIPDPTPMAPPVGYRRQPTMAEIIRQQIQGEALARAAREMGKESWQDADDFDVGDDYDPSSPWEEQFDPVGYAPGALQRHEAAFLKAQATQAAENSKAASTAAPVSGTDTPSAPGGAEGKPAKPAPSPATSK